MWGELHSPLSKNLVLDDDEVPDQLLKPNIPPNMYEYMILVLYLFNYCSTYHRSEYVVHEQYVKDEQKKGLFAQFRL